MSVTLRKRTASQAQLPNRLSKYPRTEEGNKSSDSDRSRDEGVMRLWSWLYSTGRDTLSHLFRHNATVSSEDVLPAYREEHPTPLPTKPIASSTPNGRITVLNAGRASSSTFRQQPDASTSQTQSIPTSPHSISNFDFDGPSFSRSSAFDSPASTSVRSDSTINFLTESLTSERAKFRAANGIRKPRKHIHAKLHKAAVKEKLAWELYEMQRSKGYTSDFDTFRGYLAYRQRLKQSEPTSKASLSIVGKDVESQLDLQFGRAVEKARKSLESPRPPRPFSPTIDQLRLATRARDEAIKNRLHPKRPSLPDRLPDEIQLEVEQLLQKRGVVAKLAKEQVSDRDISRLMPGQWLNDEIINFYGQLIMSRVMEADAGKENGNKFLDAHYFNTFFWTKLKTGYEKSRLSKWTKKLDIFSKDIILIPVNHNNSHWTAAAINFRRKRIESYDSMDLNRTEVYRALRVYLDEEHKNKKKKPFDFTGWQDFVYEETPQQENGHDCGVFTCQFLETLSRGEETFNFTQRNMLYMRQRMIWEIGRAKLGEPC